MDRAYQHVRASQNSSHVPPGKMLFFEHSRYGRKAGVTVLLTVILATRRTRYAPGSVKLPLSSSASAQLNHFGARLAKVEPYR